jgi:hypothetical protein
MAIEARQPDWILQQPRFRRPHSNAAILAAMMTAAESVTTGRRSIWSVVVALWLAFVGSIGPVVVELLSRAATPCDFERRAVAWVGGALCRIGTSLVAWGATS